MGQLMIATLMLHETFSRSGMRVSLEKSPVFNRGEDVNYCEYDAGVEFEESLLREKIVERPSVPLTGESL